MSNKIEGKKEVVYPDLAARFTMLLELLELNPRQFALKIGSTPQNISNYVLGYALPGGNVLKQIADRLPKVNINWLLTGTGEPVTNGYKATRQPVDPKLSTIEASPLQVVSETENEKELKRRVRWLEEQVELWQKIATSGVDLSRIATGTDGPSFPSGNPDSAGEPAPVMMVSYSEPLAA